MFSFLMTIPPCWHGWARCIRCELAAWLGETVLVLVVWESKQYFLRMPDESLRDEKKMQQRKYLLGVRFDLSLAASMYGGRGVWIEREYKSLSLFVFASFSIL